MAFNAPPNWPAPPRGWEPGPDWRPDPSWPAAPPGWVFWTKAPKAVSGPPQSTRLNRSVSPSSGSMVSEETLREALPVPATRPGITALQRLSNRLPTAAAVRRIRDQLGDGMSALGRVVNPIRVLYALAAAAGGALFVWMFTVLRFTAQWDYEGWMWHGVWPVLAMACGLVVGVVGVVGVWRWDHGRWVDRRITRRQVAAS